MDKMLNIVHCFLCVSQCKSKMVCRRWRTLPHPVRSEGEPSLLYTGISAAFHRNEGSYTTTKKNICNVSFWGTYSLCNIVFGTIRYIQKHHCCLHLMDMPHIRVLHPDFSQSVSDEGFEERFIAETSGTVRYLYLLVVFTLCDRRDNNEKTERWFKPGVFNL